MSTGQDQPWTIKRLLDWTTEYLEKHGSESARLEAETLLGHVLKWPRIQLYAQYDSVPSEADRTAFRQLILARAKGKPVAYLIGHREFFSLELEVTPQVLIPRPETEFLVVEALDRLKQWAAEGATCRVLDIGTGSGAISIAIAKHASNAMITAVDISPQALQVAQRNAQRHRVDDRITWLESNLFEGVPPDATFDLIVSNPPYIGERERSQLDRDVIDYEPELALFSGEDGTDLSRQLITEAERYLKKRGWLMLESSPMIMPMLVEHLESTQHYTQIQVVKDLGNLARILVAQRA